MRIGVTGHRKLYDDFRIRDSVRKVLGEIEELLHRELRCSPYTFTVISPIAEGSDTIVAQEVMDWKVSDRAYPPFLEVVLPMAEEEYLTDFESSAAIDEFHRLSARARVVRTLKGMGSRKASFENVGKYVVHNCDVLIAIWDGKDAAGRGGTGDIVAYAGKLGHLIAWINSETGELKWIDPQCAKPQGWDPERLLRPLRLLDVYNGERINVAQVARKAESYYSSLHGKAVKAGLGEEAIRPFRDDLIVKYERASLLAKKYQKLYYLAGSAIYVLSALAVATVAVQALFLHEYPEALWLEVIYILLIIGITAVSNRIGWHRRWIDYRFLAERMRVAIFFAMAGIQYEPLKYPPYMDRSAQSDYWIVKAFSWIWGTRPRRYDDVAADFAKLKGFLKTAWIEDQLEFYTDRSEKQIRLHERYEMIGLALFLLTLIAAFVHSSRLEERLFHHELVDPNVLALVGIVFPAIGASIAGILMYREYRKNSERYGQMVAPLLNIKQQVDMAGDMESLVRLLDEANELMLRENQDWRVSFLSQSLRPP